jgi:predicted dehydrogenase
MPSNTVVSMTASIVVIGAGTIGELHANVVREHPAARLSAIVDTDLDRATEVATRHDVTATDEPRPELATADGCIIATPEPTHARLTDLSLSRDCATLLEKPIAHDLDHAKRVHEAAAASEHSVLLGHLLRFDPRYSTIKDRLDAGDLGELIS